MTTADKVLHPQPPPGSSSVAGWLLLSLLVHLFVASQFWLLQQVALRWPDKVPAWMRDLTFDSSRRDPADQTPPKDPPELPPEDPSLVFVEVDPQAVTEEAPEKTPFYSTANALAAQVTPPTKPDSKPQIDGQQDKQVRTFESSIPQPLPPATQPPPPKVEEIPEIPPPQQPVVAESKPAAPPPPPEVKPPPPAPAVGDLAVARPVVQPPPTQPVIRPTPTPTPTPTPSPPVTPAPTPTPTLAAATTVTVPATVPALTAPPAPTPVPAEQQPRKRPRRLSEVADRGMLAGQQMKQSGGASRLNLVPSLDVRFSPFGNYDQNMIFAIQRRWYDFLEQGRFAFNKAGKVVVKFKLGSDGGVRDIVVSESDVGDILSFYCSSAIIEPSPYKKWPEDMRRIVGSETRELTFTFFYN